MTDAELSISDATLIARLRDLGDHASFEPHMHHTAADRIEALIAERDALFRRATLAEEWRDHDKTRAETAEAKLSKAVEALKNSAIQLDWCQAAREISKEIDATLARVKGETK